MIADLLSKEDYALCLSPGFFCFYGQMGALHALEEANALRATHVSGASAGAIVGGFLASGMKPSEMPKAVFAIDRKDIWDMGGIGGLLRGQLLHEILERHLTVKKFSECVIPLGITAWDLARFRTNLIQDGCIATAIRASACFPVLFAPVVVDGTPHIDGGVFDDGGLMALPGVPPSNLVVNIVCGRGRLASSVLPEKFKDARLLTIVLDNIPSVHPFSMGTSGPIAYQTARAAMHRALIDGHIMQMSHKHWVVHLDGTNSEMPENIFAGDSVMHPTRTYHFVQGISSAKNDGESNECSDLGPSKDNQETDKLEKLDTVLEESSVDQPAVAAQICIVEPVACTAVTVCEVIQEESCPSTPKKTPNKRKISSQEVTPAHAMTLRKRDSKK